MAAEQNPEQWNAANLGETGQALVIDERTGKNIAVVYDAAHAKLLASAPRLLHALCLCERALEERDTEAEQHAVKNARALIYEINGA